MQNRVANVAKVSYLKIIPELRAQLSLGRIRTLFYFTMYPFFIIT